MGWLSDIFGGGGSKQTTTTNTAPWKSAQPVLETALKHANKEFMRDPRGQNTVFTGSTVIPWSQQTRQGMGFIQGIAGANSGGRGLSGQYQDLINQGGLTNAQMGAMNTLQSMPRSGLTDAQQGAMQALQEMPRSGLTPAQTEALTRTRALAANPFNSYQDAALRNTQNTANSKFDLNANPAFQQVLQQAQNAARDSVNISAGGAGRYGSGVHQGNLASEVGDLTSRMVGNEYQNWQNRRDAANQNLFSMGQTGVGTQLAANSNAANLGQTGLTNRMNTQNAIFGMGQTGLGNRQNNANAIFGMGQAGIGNLGNAYEGLKQPGQDLMQVGAMNEDLATRQMNDKLRIFNEQNDATWNQIAKLNAIASGAGSLGSTTTQAQPGQNPFMTALGYGATGAGLLGGLWG